MSSRSLKGLPKVPIKGTLEWRSFTAKLERDLGRSLTRKEIKQLMRIADKQHADKHRHNWRHVDQTTKEHGYKARPEYHERRVVKRMGTYNLADDKDNRGR